jgi:hypothetical protein
VLCFRIHPAPAVVRRPIRSLRSSCIQKNLTTGAQPESTPQVAPPEVSLTRLGICPGSFEFVFPLLVTSSERGPAY